MGHYLSDSGYICYVKSDVPLYDTHGGRSGMHRREQEEVINEIVDKKLEFAMVAIRECITQMISAYAAEVWADLISSLKGALNTDVIAEVEIAFDNAKEIFYGKKAQEYVAKNIYDAINKELSKLKTSKIKM